jgi:uncharacterized protein (TIRG00374 family)
VGYGLDDQAGGEAQSFLDGKKEVTLREKTFTALKVLISLGLIAYLFTRIDLAEVKKAVASANYVYLALALALYFGAIALNVYKWGYLLRAQGLTVPFINLLNHTFVGLFFANLPLSQVMGDIARGVDLARHTKGHGAEVAVSVLMDRLVGLASFLFASAVTLAFAVFSLGRTDLTSLWVTVLLVLLAFATTLAVLLSRRLRGLAEQLFTWQPLSRFTALYRNLSGAVQMYRSNTGALAVAFFVALLGVLMTNVVNFLAAESVQAAIPLLWIFVFNPLTPIAQFIPSIGSGLGVNQGVFVLLYSIIGGVTDQPQALAMSLVMQVVIYIASLPGGVLWWQTRKP